jgi:tetratricopeptide (TPR) repeat protein
MNPVIRNFLIGVGIAAVLGGGIYLYISKSEAPILAQVMQPSLSRPYIITAELPEDAKTILRSNVEKIVAELKENPEHFETWFELATHYKIAGDYKGAEEIWQYITVNAPANMHYVAWANLGDLYMNFIKDYPKAEEYYKKAIALKSDEISLYADMYRLYRYLYKTDTSAAADILAEGLRSNPGDKDLHTLQDELKSGK